MPRRTWRELEKYLSCRGGQKKENPNEALRPICKEPSTQSSETNIEEQSKRSRWERFVHNLLTCGRGNPDDKDDSPTATSPEQTNGEDDTERRMSQPSTTSVSAFTTQAQIEHTGESDVLASAPNDPNILNNVLESSTELFKSIASDRIPSDGSTDARCYEAEGSDLKSEAFQNDDGARAAAMDPAAVDPASQVLNLTVKTVHPVQVSSEYVEVESHQGRADTTIRQTRLTNLPQPGENQDTVTNVTANPEFRGMSKARSAGGSEVTMTDSHMTPGTSVNTMGQDNSMVELKTAPTVGDESVAALTHNSLTSLKVVAVTDVTAAMVDDVLQTLAPVAEMEDESLNGEVAHEEEYNRPTFYGNMMAYDGRYKPVDLTTGHDHPQAATVGEGSSKATKSSTSSAQNNQTSRVEPKPGSENATQQNSSLLASTRQNSITRSTQHSETPAGEQQSYVKPSALHSFSANATPNPSPKPNTQHPVTNDDQMHDVLANSYALPRRSREAASQLHHSASVPPASVLSAGRNTVANAALLSKKGLIADYHPVPADIKEFVTQVAQDKRIECGAIYQSPEDPKELQIIGINATSMSDVVTETIERFPGFTFLLKDCVDPRHLVEYGANAIFDVTKSVYNTATGEQESVCEAMCGMILVGRTLAHHSIDAHYVVVPAHLVLQHAGNDDTLREDVLRKDQPKTIDEIKVAVDGRAAYDSYILKLHNSDKKLDVVPNPLFGYRYFYDSNNGRRTTWNEFTNDIALLKIEPYELMKEFALRPVITREHLKYAMTKNKEFPFVTISGSFEEHLTTIENIFPLRNRETLIEMGRQRVNIFVGPHLGYMVPCGESISTDGRNWTSAIEFVIFGRKFQRGDCGLIVHVQDRRSPKELYPLGMFVGKSTRTHKCGLTVWVAVVLRQCIDEIEAKYPHLVSNLRPMEKTIDRDTDGERLVQNLNRNQLVVSQSGSCGDMGAAAADSVDTGYGDSTPETSSHDHSSMRH